MIYQSHAWSYAKCTRCVRAGDRRAVRWGRAPRVPFVHHQIILENYRKHVVFITGMSEAV